MLSLHLGAGENPHHLKSSANQVGTNQLNIKKVTISNIQALPIYILSGYSRLIKNAICNVELTYQ